MLKLIYLVGFSLCVVVTSNPAYQRIPVWVYPQNECPHNQNPVPNGARPIKSQIPQKGTETIKTAIAQEVVDKILENPVISAIMSPTGNEVMKPKSNVINNYIIVPSEFLKLNESFNKIISQDTGYKIIQANTKDSKATKRKPTQQSVQYRNKNSNRIAQQNLQYQRLQDTRPPFGSNSFCPNNYHRRGCPKCDRRQMQYKRPSNLKRRPTQQKTRNVLNSRTKAKNTQKPIEEISDKKSAVQKNNCLSNLEAELFKDLGNLYDPKPVQRHCESIDDTNCIRKEETHTKIKETSLNKPKKSRQKNNNTKQNDKNKVRNDRHRATSRDEATIKNFVTKFPNIPEEVIRKVVHDVKKQLSETVTKSRTKPKDQQPKLRQHKNNQKNTDNKTGYNQEVWQPPYYSTRPYESKKNKPAFSLAQQTEENAKVNKNNYSRESNSNDNRSVTQHNESLEITAEHKYHDYVPTTKETELILNENTQTTSKSPVGLVTTTQVDKITQNLLTTTTTKQDDITTEGYIFYEDDIKYPELGAEDVVLQVPNLINDYFPDFKIDNKAHSLKDDDIFDTDYFENWRQEDGNKNLGNNKVMSSFLGNNEVISKFLGNDGVTSKLLSNNEETSRSLGNNEVISKSLGNDDVTSKLLSKNQETSKYLGNNEQPTRFLGNNQETLESEDYEITTPKNKKVKERSDIPFDSYSDEYVEDSAEIKYQTPPGLDRPNFLSKKINPKVLLNTEELNIYTEDYHYRTLNEVIGEQLSRYTTKDFASNSQDIEDILNEIHREGLRDSINQNVETVYARSKVINYGKDKKENIDSSFDETTQTTIVLARSYPDDEYW